MNKIKIATLGLCAAAVVSCGNNTGNGALIGAGSGAVLGAIVGKLAGYGSRSPHRQAYGQGEG